MSENLTTIAVDAMGGDNSPYKALKGTEFFSKNNPNIKIILFGEETIIKETIHTNKIVIKNYDILLHLSLREGLPVSVMQSLSSGLPVICYNIRGNNDLIIDRFNGYFVNSYKDVPNKIYYLNLEKQFLNMMRMNAFKTINKNFLKEKINYIIYNIIKNYSKQ